jgi:hypothetical protein
MFMVHCERHDTDVMLGWDNIVSVVNGADGIELEWACYCGHHGRLTTHHHAPTIAA